MKKRLMMALAAGALVAATVPGVASAQGAIDYELLCRGGAASAAGQAPDSNLADFLGPFRAENGNNAWGQLMRFAHQPDGICKLLEDDTNPLP